MELCLTKNDVEFGRRFFSEYKQKTGSEHIASEFAITHLSALLGKIKPTTVIEYGAGIGTMTHALLEHSAAIEKVITTEANEFCLQQLAINIPEQYSERLTVVKQKSDLKPFVNTCDLVIFDGGTIGSEETTYLGKDSVCFIEGDRKITMAAINKQLGKVGLICNFKNYNQGYRYLFFDKKVHAEKGRRETKFKFRKLIKGFQIGLVVAI